MTKMQKASTIGNVVNSVAFFHRMQKEADRNVLLYGRSGPKAVKTRQEMEALEHQRKMRLKFLDRIVLRPDGPFRTRWDLVQFFLLLYISITVPFRVGLNVPAQGSYFVLELTIDAFFYVDMVLNFITGYESHDGILVMEPKAIAQNYLRTWFALDFIACVPVDLLTRALQGTLNCSFSVCHDHKVAATGTLFRLFKILRLARLIKLLRLFNVGRILERYSDDLFLVLPAISILKLIIMVLFLGHIFGCFFYYFSTQDWRNHGEQQAVLAALNETSHVATSLTGVRKLTPWIVAEFGGELGEPGTADLVERYIAAMYWAFTTLCTVGYGDISATTQAERLMAIGCMIVGGFVFSGIIANIGSLVTKVDAARSAYNEKMEAVTGFIRESCLPRDLRSRVLAFFRKQQVRSYNARAILSQLPFELRSSVLLHLYRDIITKVPFFNDADEIFMTDVCLRLQPVMFSPGVFIYQAGEIGREMFILIKGEVEVLGPDKRVTRVLYEGSYFGEGSVLGETRRSENIRARTTCNLCSLECDDLEELLMSYPHMEKALRRVYMKRKQHFLKAATPPVGADPPDTNPVTASGFPPPWRVNPRGVTTSRGIGAEKASFGQKLLRMITLKPSQDALKKLRNGKRRDRKRGGGEHSPGDITPESNGEKSSDNKDGASSSFDAAVQKDLGAGPRAAARVGNGVRVGDGLEGGAPPSEGEALRLSRPSSALGQSAVSPGTSAVLERAASLGQSLSGESDSVSDLGSIDGDDLCGGGVVDDALLGGRAGGAAWGAEAVKTDAPPVNFHPLRAEVRAVRKELRNFRAEYRSNLVLQREQTQQILAAIKSLRTNDAKSSQRRNPSFFF